MKSGAPACRSDKPRQQRASLLPPTPRPRAQRTARANVDGIRRGVDNFGFAPGHAAQGRMAM